MRRLLFLIALASVFAAAPLAAQGSTPKEAPHVARRDADPRLARLKARAIAQVDGEAKMVQEIVDELFSFGELGMQEVETSKYLTAMLEKNGFTVERGVAGIPTAWVARWGSGKPVISLGSDIDGIPQASQKAGLVGHDALVAGAPGHGEGHNSGQAVNIAAALAVKALMERDKIPGTLVLWPGVAEESIAGKPFLVRAGVFKDVDVTLFSHVGANFGTYWGDAPMLATVTALFSFKGSSAHAAAAPWRGRSALDAVMLMGQGWEFRREHLEPMQRSHYVIVDGGAQPNVVPATASIWFQFRERDYEHVQTMFETAKRIAKGAAMMTDTELDSVTIRGSAWRPHGSRPVAEALYENIKSVGLPKWSDDEQAFAKAVQREVKSPDAGLATTLYPILTPEVTARIGGIASDDIGDVSWTVPTVIMNYPSNIPGTPGHNWADAMAMATPIAHKGAVAGAKVAALTLLDLLLTPSLVADAKTYFRDVQTKTVTYRPFIGPDDKPPIWLNAETMARFRPEMSKYYYDPAKYRTYLEQLGIPWPAVKKPMQ